jgi:hypothetical protein
VHLVGFHYKNTVIRGQNPEQLDYSISITVYLVSCDGNAIRPTVAMQQLQSSWGAWQPTAVVLAVCHQAHRRWHARIHGMLRDTGATIQNTVAIERLTELTLAWHERAKKDKGTSNQDTPCISRNLPMSITTFMTAHQINPVCSAPRVQQLYGFHFKLLHVSTPECHGQTLKWKGQWRTFKILIFYESDLSFTNYTYYNCITVLKPT